MADLAAAMANAEFEKHEAAIASQFAQILPGRPPLDDETRSHLALFVQWAQRALVRHCPAKPITVAAFIFTQSGAGVEREKIIERLAAIEKMHDHYSLANPVASLAARHALSTVSQIEPPRSWPKTDKLRFTLLPAETRAIIAQREQDRDKELRRIQNEFAEFKRHSGEAANVATIERGNEDGKAA